MIPTVETSIDTAASIFSPEVLQYVTGLLNMARCGKHLTNRAALYHRWVFDDATEAVGQLSISKNKDSTEGHGLSMVVAPVEWVSERNVQSWKTILVSSPEAPKPRVVMTLRVRIDLRGSGKDFDKPAYPCRFCITILSKTCPKSNLEDPMAHYPSIRTWELMVVEQDTCYSGVPLL